MSDLGSQLRLAREAKSLSLEQVFKATRIKTSYLEALESNRIDALPGIVQARGFVRSYANFLGLNGEALASTLDTGRLVVSMPPAVPIEQSNKPIDADRPAVRSMTPTPAAAKPDRSPTPIQSTSRLRTPTLSTLSTKPRSTTMGGLPTPLLIVGAVVLFVVGLVLIVTALSGGKAPSPLPSASSESKLVISSVTSPTRSIASGPLSLTLVASEHVWVRVTVDGQTAFEGLLDPNATQTWSADDQVIVETGNAAALSITYNGQTSVLGQRGQVVARAWSHTGVDDVPVAAPDHANDLSSHPTSVATTTLKP